MKSPKTILEIGRKVRMLRDSATLKAGEIGVVSRVYAWENEPEVTVSLSFHDGDTVFTIRPTEMVGLVTVEVVG